MRQRLALPLAAIVILSMSVAGAVSSGTPVSDEIETPEEWTNGTANDTYTGSGWVSQTWSDDFSSLNTSAWTSYGVSHQDTSIGEIALTQEQGEVNQLVWDNRVGDRGFVVTSSVEYDNSQAGKFSMWFAADHANQNSNPSSDNGIRVQFDRDNKEVDVDQFESGTKTDLTTKSLELRSDFYEFRVHYTGERLKVYVSDYLAVNRSVDEDFAHKKFYIEGDDATTTEQIMLQDFDFSSRDGDYTTTSLTFENKTDLNRIYLNDSQWDDWTKPSSNPTVDEWEPMSDPVPFVRPNETPRLQLMVRDVTDGGSEDVDTHLYSGDSPGNLTKQCSNLPYATINAGRYVNGTYYVFTTEYNESQSSWVEEIRLYKGEDPCNLNDEGVVVNAMDPGVFYDEENGTWHMYVEGSSSGDELLHYTSDDAINWEADTENNPILTSDHTGDPDVQEVNGQHYIVLDYTDPHPRYHLEFYELNNFTELEFHDDVIQPSPDGDGVTSYHDYGNGDGAFRYLPWSDKWVMWYEGFASNGTSMTVGWTESPGPHEGDISARVKADIDDDGEFEKQSGWVSVERTTEMVAADSASVKTYVDVPGLPPAYQYKVDLKLEDDDYADSEIEGLQGKGVTAKVYKTKAPEGMRLALSSYLDINPSEIPQTGKHRVLIGDSDSRMYAGEVGVNYSNDVDLSGVVAESDTSTAESVLHTGDVEEIENKTLLIPRVDDTDEVRICPGATSLGEVSDDCTDGYTVSVNETTNGVTLTETTINGTAYYRAEGISGTGGLEVSSSGSTIMTGSCSKYEIVGKCVQSSVVFLGSFVGVLLVLVGGWWISKRSSI